MIIINGQQHGFTLATYILYFLLYIYIYIYMFSYFSSFLPPAGLFLFIFILFLNFILININLAFYVYKMNYMLANSFKQFHELYATSM